MSVVALEFWDAKRVAKAWGMSPHWVYREAKAGRLPCVRLGRRIRFVPKQLEDYWQKMQGPRDEE